ncbi:GtrA family protein [Pantoea agglomerans]
MLKLFARYASVGVLNTLIHWAVFTALYAHGSSQSLSNFTAFCVAVTFSFFVNAKWTFNQEATTTRYLLYVVFMGAMAGAIGWLADKMHIPALITLIIFSALSLFCGFAYSKLLIFRDKQ